MLAALMLAGCDYQEEFWIDFTDLSQITDGGFKVISQKVDNLEKDGIPKDCYKNSNFCFSGCFGFKRLCFWT